MAGAVAAAISRAKIGTWVMSALHRNAGIIAKAAETLDEISGGRFVFGLGAGHEWPGQAHAFGLPEDHIFGRFEEALEIIIPLLRGGHANFGGTWHAARDLPSNRSAHASGSAEEMANAFRTFREAGFTQLEMMVYPGTLAALDALAPVLELLDND